MRPAVERRCRAPGRVRGGTLTPLNPVQLDRAAGALVGLAAGDALGAGYEFESVVPDPPRMIGGGLGGWDPGEWTDDTQMAICIAEVTATGDFDLAAIAGQFLYWFGRHPPDVGNQTRAVLGPYRSGDDLTAIAAAHYERNPRNAAGNGSL
ncbi:MAG TPA: ADP-ribosylglycohydrolase family protein, partial [Aeromicrobium sp.]|nr:ADP-ribosylglycohydrolase family protein [Aeromicrobium sp.]